MNIKNKDIYSQEIERQSDELKFRYRQLNKKMHNQMNIKIDIKIN